MQSAFSWRYSPAAELLSFKTIKIPSRHISHSLVLTRGWEALLAIEMYSRGSARDGLENAQKHIIMPRFSSWLASTLDWLTESFPAFEGGCEQKKYSYTLAIKIFAGDCWMDFSSSARNCWKAKREREQDYLHKKAR